MFGFGKKNKDKATKEAEAAKSGPGSNGYVTAAPTQSVSVSLDRRPSQLPVAPTKNKNPEESYLIKKKLGEGAFGVCHMVEDIHDGSAYVLKRMKCRDKEEMLEALKEMVMMRICVSPFVVKFKEFFKDDRTLEVCLVMEFCEEGDLFHRLREAYETKNPLAEDRILRWFVQILLGLEAIHSKKFVHRDLKPGNIFLSRWDVVKLGDFGLGVFTGREKPRVKDDEVAGTPGFIAPEILQNLPYDAKSDVYALGCCLYEMLTLRSAYYDTKNDCFPQRPPEGLYSMEIENLLLHLLEPNPARRPSVHDVLNDPLIKQRAEEMRKEQDLLQRVMEMEDRIGYKHHERRKHAARSYLASGILDLKDKAGTITEVAEEFQAIVDQASVGDAHEEEVEEEEEPEEEPQPLPAAAAAAAPPAAAQQRNPPQAPDSRVMRADKRTRIKQKKLFDTLTNELHVRREQEAAIEKKIKVARTKSAELSSENVEEEKDRTIGRMELELMEMRNKNLAFELLFAELRKKEEAAQKTPGGPDSSEKLKAAQPEPPQSPPQPLRRSNTADLTAVKTQLVEKERSVQQLADENRALRERLESFSQLPTAPPSSGGDSASPPPSAPSSTESATLQPAGPPPAAGERAGYRVCATGDGCALM